MHINEGKDKLALFSTKYNVLLTPLPFQFYCPPQFFYSLLHNFIIFPPQCFYSLLHNFYYFPSSMFFIPLLHLHLLISIVFPPPPPPHFHCFPSSSSSSSTTSSSFVFPQKGQNQTITFEFGLIGLILAFWPFRGKTI